VDDVVVQLLSEEAAGRTAGDRLFPLTEGQARDAWEAVRVEVGRPGLRFKDLRHIFAIDYLKGGPALRQLQGALGHDCMDPTMRYIGYEPSTSPERMAAAQQASGIDFADLEVHEMTSAEPVGS
jgi:integrase